MNYEKYLEMREALMNEANALIESGDVDGAKEKMNEVRALDEKWDTIAQANADMAALDSERRIVNIQNVPGAVVSDGTVTAQFNVGLPAGDMADEGERMYASEEYVNAWARMMMGKSLTDSEKNVIAMVNAYVHTTENTGVVIPKTVASGIWDLIEEMYPYWNDVQKTYVKGNYTALIGEESTDAAWYDEATATEDGKETIGELNLTGCELSRSVTISWKLREMAVEDFIPYIQRKMARKMGAGLGYGATHGKGKPTASEFKPEPLGVVTALEKEASTPQIATYTKGALTYKDLTNTRAKIKVGGNELRVYANSATIWGELANVVDGNGKPIMVPDPTVAGVTRIFGMPVKEDDSMLDGEVLMSAAYAGYISNVNKEISILAEEHIKERQTDYCGYAIVDGGVTTTKAHALLKLGE